MLLSCGRVGFDPPGGVGDGAIDSLHDSAQVDARSVPPGPAVWLRMETDPNTTIVDSGGGHTVECNVGGCPGTAVGHDGQGYQFTANEVDVVAAADLDSSSGFTGAVWVRLSSTPASLACAWSKPFNLAMVYDTFTLCIDIDGKTVFDCETPAGAADSERGPAITPGTWHHLAMSWDGTTKHSYLDGVEVATKAVQIGAANMGLTLGGEGLAYFTPGILDDAVYYTRALTPAEIAQLATP